MVPACGCCLSGLWDLWGLAGLNRPVGAGPLRHLSPFQARLESLQLAWAGSNLYLCSARLTAEVTFPYQDYHPVFGYISNKF